MIEEIKNSKDNNEDKISKIDDSNVVKSDNSAFGPASIFYINENTPKSTIYTNMIKGINIDREKISKQILSLIAKMKPSIGRVEVINDNGDVKIKISKDGQDPVLMSLNDRKVKMDKLLDTYDIRGDKEKCFDLVDYCVDGMKEVDSGFLGNINKSDIMAIMDKETLFGKIKSGTGSHGLMQITKWPILQISQEIKKNTPGYKDVFDKLFPGMSVAQLESQAMNSERKGKDINNTKIGIIYLNFCAKNKEKYTNFSAHNLGVKNMFSKNHPEMKGFFDQKWSEYISLLSSGSIEGNRLKTLVQTSAKYNGNAMLKYSYGLYVGFVSKYLYGEYNR